MNALLRETVRGMLVELAGGCDYESDVILAVKRAGAAGRIKRAACADSSVADADIKVGGVVHQVEVKANARAQMGGGSVRYSSVDHAFTCGSECRDMSAAMIVILDAADDVEPLKNALDALVQFIDQKTPGRDITGFPMSGFSPETWEAAVTSGLLRPINRYLEADASVIEAHYAAKGTHYIQIGGAGLFRLGEANPAGFPVPGLRGKVRLELRAAKAGDAGRATSKAGLRVQARLAAAGTSPYTLDDPNSVKEMLATMTGTSNRKNGS